MVLSENSAQTNENGAMKCEDKIVVGGVPYEGDPYRRILDLIFLPSRSETVMFWAACIYLFIYWFLCVYVCSQLFSKTTGLNCMRFSGMICIIQGQSIRFWERSGQRSRSRSRKGLKHIFVITRSVFVRFI